MRKLALCALLLSLAWLAFGAFGTADAQSVNGWNLGAAVSGNTSGAAQATPPFRPAMPGVVTSVIVYDGDSLTNETTVQSDGGIADGGTTNGFQSYAERSAEMLGSSVVFHDTGRGGYTCAQLLSTLSNWACPFVQPGKRNVYVFQCGVNDVAFHDAGSWGQTEIINEYISISNAARACGFQKVLLVGMEANVYFDPQNSNYTGVDIAPLDTASAALFPAYVDGYVRVVGDQIEGVTDGGSAFFHTGCIPYADPSSWGNECFYVDALIHPTQNRDTYTAWLVNTKLVPLLL